MKRHIALTSAFIATLATASAHPGHDHSHMDTFQFAWHHWLTGGSLVALLGIAAYVWRSRSAAKAKAEARRKR